MRELVTMWKDVRMVALADVIAPLYAVGLLPFSNLVLVKGFTTVRPGNALPVVFALMFGPAAAWGSAFGNLFSDVFGGTLSMASAFGFVANFFTALAAYKLWGNLGRLSSGEEPTMRSPRQLLEYAVVAFVAAVGISVVAVAWLLAGIGISVWVHGVPLVVAMSEVTLGSGGSTLQIAVGAVAFAVLVGASAMAGERLYTIYRPATRPA